MPGNPSQVRVVIAYRHLRYFPLSAIKRTAESPPPPLYRIVRESSFFTNNKTHPSPKFAAKGCDLNYFIEIP